MIRENFICGTWYRSTTLTLTVLTVTGDEKGGQKLPVYGTRRAKRQF